MSTQINNLIAVSSGTKGAGKTWLATTLCHSLALLKKRVLLFDGDCGLENAASQLGLNASMAYNRLFSGNTCLNNAVTRFEKGHFDIVCSRPSDNGLSTASVGRTQILARDLLHFAKYYDYVLIDGQSENSKTGNIFLNICHTGIILVNAEPSSVAKTYQKLEELKKINPDMQVGIIINRAFSYNEGNQIFKTLLKAANEYIKIKIKLIGIIRQDARIREAVANQALLLQRYPACEGAEDAVLACRRLMENW